jgi:hypothetical protein
LLVELAKDAMGVSQLPDRLFEEDASRSQRTNGVHVFIRFLFNLSGGYSIAPSPELSSSNPYTTPQVHSPRPLKGSQVIRWSASS